MASQAVTIGTESISGSLQGVELRTFGQVYQGMMPKIRPLNSNILVVDGRRIDNLQKYDENLSTLIGTKKVEEFPNFEREDLSFGMPKEFRDDTIFEDMANFNPVAFIRDEGSTLIYPQVLSNLSAKDLDTYDGVIEPLVIRSRASRNSIDSPFEAHDVRGALSNAAEDVRRRGNLIVDYVFPVDRSVEPYLDELFEQDTLGLPQPPFLSNPSDLTPPFEDGTDWEDRENYNLGEGLYPVRRTLTSWNPAIDTYVTSSVSGFGYTIVDFRSYIVAHFDFDSPASIGSSVNDKTGNGHVATLFNAATVDSSPFPGYIASRGSLNLTTNSISLSQDYLRIEDREDLRTSAGKGFSISFWLRQSLGASSQVVIAKTSESGGSTAAVDYRIEVDSFQRMSFNLNDDGATASTNNFIFVRSAVASITAGAWQHIVVTYDGGISGALKIYINGADASDTSGVTGLFDAPRATSDPIFLGSRPGSNSDLIGYVGSIEFWNTNLTDTQALQLYGLQLQTTLFNARYYANLGEVSTEQFFPRGSTSARSGQIVNLEDSPGTDSIAYAGMKR